MSDLREKLESAKSGAESLYAFCEGEWYQDLAKAIRDTLADVIKVLNPSLDENGLARCGCGGKAGFHYSVMQRDNDCCVACGTCGVHSRVALCEEEARDAWNRAMGWRVER